MSQRCVAVACVHCARKGFTFAWINKCLKLRSIFGRVYCSFCVRVLFSKFFGPILFTTHILHNNVVGDIGLDSRSLCLTLCPRGLTSNVLMWIATCDVYTHWCWVHMGSGIFRKRLHCWNIFKWTQFKIEILKTGMEGECGVDPHSAYTHIDMYGMSCWI